MKYLKCIHPWLTKRFHELRSSELARRQMSGQMAYAHEVGELPSLRDTMNVVVTVWQLEKRDNRERDAHSGSTASAPQHQLKRRKLEQGRRPQASTGTPRISASCPRPIPIAAPSGRPMMSASAMPPLPTR